MTDTHIQLKIKKWIEKAIVDNGWEYHNPIALEHPSIGTYGDFSCNVAMSLAKQLAKNPKEVAIQIAEAVKSNEVTSEIIKNIDTAGVGFINIYVRDEVKLKEAERINYEVEFKNYLAENSQGKKVVIDYSAPNIAKPFGIGHLRSTNIGQALYNLYKTLGWKTIGDNHLGDWGTQFGKLIVAIKKWGDKSVENMTIEDLEKLYVKFHHEAEKDESLNDLGREWFTKLERNDPEAREIWQKCVDTSLMEFNRVYDLLNVKIDYALGEAFYEDKMADIVEELRLKKLTKISQRAEIVEFDDMPPAIVIKSDGGTTYFTRDLATIKYRLTTWNPDLIIYEVGADQQLHFRQLFRTVENLGWTDQKKLVHIAHGLLRWTTGKFSTRKGDTIHLSDVIDKAMDKAKEIAEHSQINKIENEGEKQKMIEAVAIGAVKFTDLASDPKKDVIFDWEQIMNLEGDSGPYLQYTYARCQSVLSKTEIKEQKNIGALPNQLNDEEIKLLNEFYKFEEKIIEAARRYSPAVLAEYLLGVARTYNEFYAKHRIIGEKEEVWRIFLTKTTASTLKMGLDILGIKTVDKM